MDNRFKTQLKAFAAIIAIVFLAGLIWLGTGDRTTAVGGLLSYAAGLSMIVLPCTLPLVFIIVPMSLKDDPKKGFLTALLFGLGVTVTLTFYGVIVAWIGKFLGLDQATRVMFTVAGVAAYLFGLSELNILDFDVPGLQASVPSWIQNQGDYIKPFFMGLFLGNAGIGCPNPAFYVLLTYIASVGSYLNGAYLGFLHGLGRATPLILLAILAILGVNATNFVVERKDTIKRITGWALLLVGIFILLYGIYGMNWWEHSIFHREWQDFLLNTAPQLAEKPDHPVTKGVFKAPIWLGWTTFLVLFELPALLYGRKKKHGEIQ